MFSPEWSTAVYCFLFSDSCSWVHFCPEQLNFLWLFHSLLCKALWITTVYEMCYTNKLALPSCCSLEKSFISHKFFGFPAALCFWTLSNNDCMILRSIFSHRGQLRDSFASITEDSNAHRCCRRKNHALRAGAWNTKDTHTKCSFNLVNRS